MLEWLRGVLGLLLVDPWTAPLSVLMLGAVLLGPLARIGRRRSRRKQAKAAEQSQAAEPPGTAEPPAKSAEPPVADVAPPSPAPPPAPAPATLYRYQYDAGPPAGSARDTDAGDLGTADLTPADLLPEEPGRTRYANAALLDPGGDVLPAAIAALAPGAAVLLRLDIGPLAVDSQVTAPLPFPDERLPDMAELEVLVSSTDFAVARIDADGHAQGAAGPVARGRLTLPRDGGPATAPDGGVHLRFRLTAPAGAGTAHCRIGYYYRDTLLQSQQLTAAIGGTGYAIRTDFTLSEDFTGLQAIPERPRISVLTNANHDGDHQLVIRPPGAPGAGTDGVTLRVGHQAIGEVVHRLRKAIGERAPSTARRRPDELAEDLRRLAPIGWKLNVTLTGHTSEIRDRMLDAPEGAVIQVLRPAGSVFALPWGWIYDIPLSAEEPELCPLLRDWDGRSPLFESTPGGGTPTECPHGPHFEDVLCPFGFWGFRHVIEQLSSTDRPVLTVPVAQGCDMVVAQTRYDVDRAALGRHVATLGATLRAAYPAGRLAEAADKAAVRAALGRDLALVYFYCHGERRNATDPDIYLSVGDDEAIPAPEFIGWVDVWRRRDRLRVWDGVRPLVFVNACHSAAIYPETLVSYLDAFVGRAHAAGVIGTEVKVHQDLAMAFAERFFELLLGGPQASPMPVTVGEALRTIRLEYLAQGNLIGLMYTPYCWADLRLART